jgi:hypothetical protein
MRGRPHPDERLTQGQRDLYPERRSVRQRRSAQARSTHRPYRPRPQRDQESPLAVQSPRRGSRRPPIRSRPCPDCRARRSRSLGSRARAGYPGPPCGWYRESSPRASRRCAGSRLGIFGGSAHRRPRRPAAMARTVAQRVAAVREAKVAPSVRQTSWCKRRPTGEALPKPGLSAAKAAGSPPSSESSTQRLDRPKPGCEEVLPAPQADEARPSREKGRSAALDRHPRVVVPAPE